jgi:hypothetical protein
MYDRDAFEHIATAITMWEVTAQQMPLTELRAVVTTYQNGLAESLNSFHDLYDHDADQVPADILGDAVGTIARQATAAAIFALGVSQRVRLAAQQN